MVSIGMMIMELLMIMAAIGIVMMMVIRTIMMMVLGG